MPLPKLLMSFVATVCQFINCTDLFIWCSDIFLLAVAAAPALEGSAWASLMVLIGCWVALALAVKRCCSLRLCWHILCDWRSFPLLGQYPGYMSQPVRPRCDRATLLKGSEHGRGGCFIGKSALTDGPLNGITVFTEERRLTPARCMPDGWSG
jgi:hypothetical protein